MFDPLNPKDPMKITIKKHPEKFDLYKASGVGLNMDTVYYCGDLVEQNPVYIFCNTDADNYQLLRLTYPWYLRLQAEGKLVFIKRCDWSDHLA